MALRSVRACALVGLALLVTSCTVGPNYTRPIIETPATYRGADAAATPEAQSLADQQWSAVFQDEALHELIQRALTQGYDIRAAAARVLEAQAQLGVTRADQFPTASGQVTVAGQRGTPSGTAASRTVAGTQLLASSAWQLDFWGRYRRATEAARAELLASEWGRRAVMTTIVSEIAQGYFRLRMSSFLFSTICCFTWPRPRPRPPPPLASLAGAASPIGVFCSLPSAP